MRIEESPGRLVVRDNPALFWGFYSLFLAAGGGSIYLAWTAAPDPTTRWIAGAIGLGNLAGGLYMLRKEPASVVELDRAAGTLRLTRWGLFGRRREELPLAGATGAEIETSEHSDGGAIYRPVIVLASGEKRAVSLFWYQTEWPSAAVAERIGAFLQGRSA